MAQFGRWWTEFLLSVTRHIDIQNCAKLTEVLLEMRLQQSGAVAP